MFDNFHFDYLQVPMNLPFANIFATFLSGKVVPCIGHALQMDNCHKSLCRNKHSIVTYRAHGVKGYDD